jgi:hypothetical protein
LDTISFLELRRMAEMHKTVPEDEAAEELRWIKLLEAADPRGIPVDASTQYTSSSAPTTPSPRRRLLEGDSGRRRASLIREDTAERQWVPGDDIVVVEPSPVVVDHVSSSTNSVGSPTMSERQSSHLTPLTVQNTGRFSKRTRDVSPESPAQPLKRQKILDSPKGSCLLSPKIIPKVPPNSSRPFSDIINFSLKPCTTPITAGSWRRERAIWELGHLILHLPTLMAHQARLEATVLQGTGHPHRV